MNLVSSILRPFARHAGGSVSISFGLIVIFLFTIMGAALDFGKWSNAAQHAENAMDDALLAAGRQLQTEPDLTDKALETAQTFFNHQIKGGIDIDGTATHFAIVDGGMGIEGRVSGTVKTPFLRMINIPNLAVVKKAKVAFNVGGSSGSSLEVALMLDVTGSMCADGQGPCKSSPKMDALKQASKDLINIVIVNGQNTRAALIPFSTRVRVAESDQLDAGVIMKKVTNLDPTWTGWINECTSGSGSGGSEGSGNWTCSNWQPKHQSKLKIMPCVSDRTGPAQFTDAAPGANTWLNAHEGTRFPLSYDSSETPIASGLGHTKADVAGQWNYVDDGSCADVMEKNVLLPLTGDSDALKHRIDDLEAYGSTGGALGTAWAWYTLSPNWSSVWTGPSVPGPYADLSTIGSGGKPKLRKIAVLMTDGDYNTYRTNKDAIPQDVSNNAKSICANMKAQGVEIFAIGFDLDALPAAKRTMAIDTLQSCGSDINHFYNSLDAAQLKGAFRDIALKLSQLYVAK